MQLTTPRQDARQRSSGIRNGFIYPFVNQRFISNRHIEQEGTASDEKAHYFQRALKPRAWLRKNPPSDFWKVINTPLSAYALPRGVNSSETRLNFEEYLRAKAQQAAGNKQIFRVLDVGAGTLQQWEPFLKEFGRTVDFNATVLTKTGLASRLVRHTIECSAAYLPLFFGENSFDLVVSHYGMHADEHVGIENAILLLKVGGEAIISGLELDSREMENFPLLAINSSSVVVLSSDSHTYSIPNSRHTEHFVHLRKVAHPFSEMQPCAEPRLG